MMPVTRGPLGRWVSQGEEEKEEEVGPAPKFDADEGTVEKALRKNPPEKTAPKASAWEPDS